MKKQPSSEVPSGASSEIPSGARDPYCYKNVKEVIFHVIGPL
jgi:hypothetical protein